MTWTIPNILTVFRLLAALAVPILFALDGDALGDEIWRWAAFGLFVAASITDFFDGWLARRLNQQSAVGKMLDPIADKAAVVLALLALNIAGGWAILLPSIVILFRETLISGVREFIGQSAGLSVTRLAKWKTTAQMVAITLLLIPQSPLPSELAMIERLNAEGGGHFILLSDIVGPLGAGLLWLAAALTLITGWDYLRKALKHLEASS